MKSKIKKLFTVILVSALILQTFMSHVALASEPDGTELIEAVATEEIEAEEEMNPSEESQKEETTLEEENNNAAKEVILDEEPMLSTEDDNTDSSISDTEEESETDKVTDVCQM